MKNILKILLLVFALSTLSVAQSQSSNAQNSAASGIVSSPTIDTTDHSATLHWKTADRAGTIVWFGTERNNLKREAREGGAGGSLEHNVTLNDLKPGTKYFYRILKGDADVRTEGEFTTKGAAQAGGSNAQNPASGIVSGPTVETTDRSASIHWKTEDRAGTIVAYGTDKNNLKKEERGGANGSLEHNITLTNLQPGTKYFYRILKGDGDVRTEGEFTTQGTAQAGSSGGEKAGSEQDGVVITQGPTFQPGADGTGKIVWKTDDIAANDVKYGTDPNNLQQRAFKQGGSRDHEAELKNLQAGQTYYFQILRRNGSVRTTGQFQYQPQAASASTPGPAAQPAQESALQFTVGPALKTVGDRSANIGWQTNNVSNTIIHYSTDPRNLNLVATGPWGTDHSVEIQNLNPNTRYYFMVESSPSAGNAVRSGIAGFQTVAPGAQAMQNPPLIH